MVHLSIPVVARVMCCSNYLSTSGSCSLSPRCSEIHSDGCLAVANPATMNDWRGDFPDRGRRQLALSIIHRFKSTTKTKLRIHSCRVWFRLTNTSCFSHRDNSRSVSPLVPGASTSPLFPLTSTLPQMTLA